MHEWNKEKNVSRSFCYNINIFTIKHIKWFYSNEKGWKWHNYRIIFGEVFVSNVRYSYLLFRVICNESVSVPTNPELVDSNPIQTLTLTITVQTAVSIPTPNFEGQSEFGWNLLNIVYFFIVPYSSKAYSIK